MEKKVYYWMFIEFDIFFEILWFGSFLGFYYFRMFEGFIKGEI